MKHTKTDEELKEIISNSISFSEAMIKCNMKPRGASYQWFQKRIRKLRLDTSHFKGCSAGGIERAKAAKKHWKDILQNKGLGRERCSFLRRSYKEYCKENSISYICQECRMNPIWNNKPIEFQIDHINEVNDDNRPENLRWICGNCHQQKNTRCQANQVKAED